MNIVVTMAGRGSRFVQAGYTVPKYEIMAHGKSLFDWSMESLAQFTGSDSGVKSRVIFVCLAENKSADYVRARSASLGLDNIEVVELAELTDGQATSAWVTRDLWQLDQPLLIYNIDTYVDPRALRPQDIRPGADGWIPCFKAAGTHWSFVALDDAGWASDIAEKQRISDNATIGLYWFARAGDYVRAYEEFFADPANLVGGERYVAPLYRQLLRDGKQVAITDIAPDQVHVLGTPAELATFVARDIGSIVPAQLAE